MAALRAVLSVIIILLHFYSQPFSKMFILSIANPVVVTALLLMSFLH